MLPSFVEEFLTLEIIKNPARHTKSNGIVDLGMCHHLEYGSKMLHALSLSLIIPYIIFISSVTRGKVSRHVGRLLHSRRS